MVGRGGLDFYNDHLALWCGYKHGRKSREDGGTRPPRIWNGRDANTNCPPRFRRLLSDPDPARSNDVQSTDDLLLKV